jgi:hypothetical protein
MDFYLTTLNEQYKFFIAFVDVFVVRKAFSLRFYFQNFSFNSCSDYQSLLQLNQQIVILPMLLRD